MLRVATVVGTECAIRVAAVKREVASLGPADKDRLGQAPAIQKREVPVYEGPIGRRLHVHTIDLVPDSYMSRWTDGSQPT